MRKCARSRSFLSESLLEDARSKDSEMLSNDRHGLFESSRTGNLGAYGDCQMFARRGSGLFCVLKIIRRFGKIILKKCFVIDILFGSFQRISFLLERLTSALIIFTGSIRPSPRRKPRPKCTRFCLTRIGGPAVRS